MIALCVEYTPGAFHANPWLSPRNGDVEWPPSPWRILATLADAWRRAGAADSAAIVALLEQLAEPPEFLLPLTTSNHTRHYRVEVPGARAPRPDMLDSTIAVVDPPRPQRVSAYIVWPNATAASTVRLLLDQLCAQVERLYDTTAACVLQSVDAVPFDDPSSTRVSTKTSRAMGPTVTRWAAASMLRGEALLAALLRPSAQRALPIDGVARTRGIEYALPQTFLLPEEQYWRHDRFHPTIDPAHLCFGIGKSRAGKRPNLRDAVAIAECFRAASIERYSRRTGEPATLRLVGKSKDSSPNEGHDHPYFLPVDTKGRGEIDAIGVWFPKRCTHEEYRAIASLTQLFERHLYHDDFPLTFVGAREPMSGTRWECATPIVLDRFPKLRGPAGAKREVDAPAEQIAAMAERLTGQRPCVEVWPSTRGIPLAHGAHLRADAFRRTRTSKNAPSYPVAAATLHFEEPVIGPLVFGRLAHFGLGRFEPAVIER